MIKKTLTFIDYNNNKVTEDYYFNLNKAELVELEVSEKSGLGELLKRIVQEEDNAMLLSYFKKIVLMSIGVKSEDGRKFQKSPEIVADFAQSEAYPTLFMELASDAKAASDFVNGVMPMDVIEDKDKPSTVPQTREELLALIAEMDAKKEAK